MTTASVARVTQPYEEIQRESVARSMRLWAELSEFPHPCPERRLGHPPRPPPVPIIPAEGWLQPSETWCPDPLGVSSMRHEVVPDGGETLRGHLTVVAANLREALHAAGFAGPAEALGQHARMCDRIDVPPPANHPTARSMAVTVVNIVHTSYCAFTAPEEPIKPETAVVVVEASEHDDADEDDFDYMNMKFDTPVEEPLVVDDAPHPVPVGYVTTTRHPTIISQRFLWRRLLHMGCQQNRVHTSLKLCFAPPFNSSHILFQTGRVLETGANNMKMARIMFEQVTLPCLRAAGLQSLTVATRRQQNIVATSAMPGGSGLDLDALHWRCSNFIEYEKESFAGAIVNFSAAPEAIQMKRLTMLAFSAGPVVCVGGSSYEELGRAYTNIYPYFLDSATARTAPTRGTKRRHATDDTKPRKRRRRVQPLEELLRVNKAAGAHCPGPLLELHANVKSQLH